MADDGRPSEGRARVPGDKELKLLAAQESGRYHGLANWVLGLHQSMSWYERVHITGWALKFKQGAWLLVVTGRRASQPVVTFIQADEPWECFDLLASFVRSKRLVWREDKYRRGDQA